MENKLPPKWFVDMTKTGLGKGHARELIRLLYWMVVLGALLSILGFLHAILWILGLGGLSDVLRSLTNPPPFVPLMASIVEFLTYVGLCVGFLVIFSAVTMTVVFSLKEGE